MAIEPSVIFAATGGSVSLSGITAASATPSTNVNTISFAAAASTADQLYTTSIDVSEIEVLFIYADGAVTMETNSSSAPAQTLVFAANKPLVWVRGMPVTCPLTTDVTALYFTVAGGSIVNIYGVIGTSL
jgi:hypothetical protein